MTRSFLRLICQAAQLRNALPPTRGLSTAANLARSTPAEKLSGTAAPDASGATLEGTNSNRYSAERPATSAAQNTQSRSFPEGHRDSLPNQFTSKQSYSGAGTPSGRNNFSGHPLPYRENPYRAPSSAPGRPPYDTQWDSPSYSPGSNRYGGYNNSRYPRDQQHQQSFEPPNDSSSSDNDPRAPSQFDAPPYGYQQASRNSPNGYDRQTPFSPNDKNGYSATPSNNGYSARQTQGAYPPPAEDEMYGQDRYRHQFRPRATDPYTQPRAASYPYTPGPRSTWRQGSPVSSHTQNYRRTDRFTQRNPSLLSPDWSRLNLPPINKNIYKEHPETANQPQSEVQATLYNLKITLRGPKPFPNPIKSFEHAGLAPCYVKQLQTCGISEPSPIQKIGLPLALSGRNMIGISRTGSGKTLAFLLPALMHIDAQPAKRPPSVLVLSPTRELAQQTKNTADQFARLRNIGCVALYGGDAKSGQITELRRNPEILVGCPGRIIDLSDAGYLTTNNISFLVLDEADRMLDMGFEPQIRQIQAQIRPDRQVLMYSATWPETVQQLAFDLCDSPPVQVQIGSLGLQANADVTQTIRVVTRLTKEMELRKLLRETLPNPNEKNSTKILIFCDRKMRCNSLAHRLNNLGFPSVCIHGDKSQAERTSAVSQFKSGRSPILVATDVAARGLDINDIALVVNFELPPTIEDYIHRIGRTARAGKKGVSVTFLEENDQTPNTLKVAKQIAQLIKQAGQTPSPEFLQFLRYTQSYR